MGCLLRSSLTGCRDYLSFGSVQSLSSNLTTSCFILMVPHPPLPASVTTSLYYFPPSVTPGNSEVLWLCLVIVPAPSCICICTSLSLLCQMILVWTRWACQQSCLAFPAVFLLCVLNMVVFFFTCSYVSLHCFSIRDWMFTFLLWECD